MMTSFDFWVGFALMKNKLLAEGQGKLYAEYIQFITDAISRHGGRIRYVPESNDDDSTDYPVTSTLYGKHDNPSINITDVYLIGDAIHADGIDNETGDKRERFFIYPEHLSDILSFVGHVLRLY